MILTKEVSTKWIPNTKRYYESKGYQYTKTEEPFMVKVEDLLPRSTVKVDCQCDICGVVQHISIHSYNRSLTTEGVYKCVKCCKAHLKKSPYEILQAFKEGGFIPMFCIDEYSCGDEKLPFICPTHEDKGLMFAKLYSIKKSSACRYCRVDKIKEFQKTRFTGREPVMGFLRSNILSWKKLSMQSCNYNCVISEGRFTHIHHLYPFYNIVSEAVTETGISIESLSTGLLCQSGEIDYPLLRTLADTVLRLHFNYPLGVCLTEELHKEFHNKYGSTNNTPEQFYEFYSCRTGGIFKPSYSSYIPVVYEEVPEWTS